MKLGFIGAGEMGGSIIRGFLKAGLSTQDLLVSVRSAESAQKLSAEWGINVSNENVRVMQEAQCLFLAVKPNQMSVVLQELAQSGSAPKPLVSMALGWTIEKIQQFVPNWSVVRIMPNTPLAIGQGVTLFEFSKEVCDSCKKDILHLFETIGIAVEVPGTVFDVTTALSGSGPAFVYAFIDALTQAAVHQGVAPQMAVQLAVQTVIGAAYMVQREGISPAALAQKVSTPGGCTAAGMDVLTHSDFAQIISRVIEATANKAAAVSKDR